MTINLKVIDISHWQSGLNGNPIDFAAIKAFGIVGVILKASQGASGHDATYDDNRQAASDAGLKVGAYHFATGDDADAQVANFLKRAAPDADTLMALDHEPYDTNLDLDGARAFLESLKDQLGRTPKMYSGNLIKEQMAKGLSDDNRAFFSGIPLWLSHYNNHFILPPAWDHYWLWQFAGDGTNNNGITVPGILHGDKVDMNSYDGTDEELAGTWAG